MAKSLNILPRVFVFAGGYACVHYFMMPTFVPPPRVFQARVTPTGAATASILGGACAAHADQALDDAAVKFADTVYPLFKKIDWFENAEAKNYWAAMSQDNNLVPAKLAVAIDKLCEAGMSMDMNLVRQAVKLHSQGIGDAGSIFRMARGNTLIAPLNDVEDMTKAIARMLGSADVNKLREVYDAFKDLPSEASLNKAFYSLDPVVAKASYKAFLEMGELVAKARDLPVGGV